MSGLTTRDFKRPEHHEFYKELSAVDPGGGRGIHELFEDFLTMTAISLQQPVKKILTGAIDPVLEEDYLKVVRKYDKERVRAHFPKAFAMLVNGLQEEIHDFLGDVYGSAGISNKWGGQFFTPWEICVLMAKMTFGDELKKKEKRITVCEPAVGGGAMLLAVACELKAADFGPWNWWVDATDIDKRCFHMAYIQLSLCGVPGVVRHGDTIAMKQWDAWLTATGALFPYRADPKERIDENEAVMTPPVELQKQMAEQMELL